MKGKHGDVAVIYKNTPFFEDGAMARITDRDPHEKMYLVAGIEDIKDISLEPPKAPDLSHMDEDMREALESVITTNSLAGNELLGKSVWVNENDVRVISLNRPGWFKRFIIRIFDL